MTNQIVTIEQIILQVLSLNVSIKQKNEIDKIVKQLRELKREYIKKVFFN